MDAGVPCPGLCDCLQERHLRAGDRGPDLSGRQGVGRHLPVSSTTHQEDTTTPLDTCQVPVPSTSIIYHHQEDTTIPLDTCQVPVQFGSMVKIHVLSAYY